MPVVVCEVYNDGDQHGEGLIFIGLQDVQEVVVLEETHGSIGYLQVDTTNAPDYSLEELGD